jgi:hypothetical protein
MEEKYRSLVLQEQTKARPTATGDRSLPGSANATSNSGSSFYGGDLSMTQRSAGLGEESSVTSDAFVQCLHDLAMVVAQDPRAELQDKIAGLELLRCCLQFDDQAAATRRLDCASVLRAVLENKPSGATAIATKYDVGLMAVAAAALGDLGAKASTLHENETLRKRCVCAWAGGLESSRVNWVAFAFSLGKKGWKLVSFPSKNIGFGG